MNKKFFLDKNTLIEIFKISGQWNATYSSSPKFYNIFIKDSIQYVNGIDTEYFKKNQPINLLPKGSLHQDCKEFVELFHNKIPLLEAFTIFKLLGVYYASNHEKKNYKKLVLFLENKIGKSNLYTLLENYFNHYGSSENSFLFSYWFELSKNNLSFIKNNNLNKFIKDYLNSITPHNTLTRNFHLKLLLFLNNFQDNRKDISLYIETHQGDSVFIKGVPKLISKIKDLTWKEVETPLFHSKKIIGTVSINSDFFIKEFKMNRGESDKFIQESLAFIYYDSKDDSVQCTSNELIIHAKSLDEYKNKEEKILKKISEIKSLAPYWIVEKNKDNKDDSLIFFKNYFTKINFHKELKAEVLNKNTNQNKTKRIKI